MPYDDPYGGGYSSSGEQTFTDLADDWGNNWGTSEAANQASQGPPPDFFIQNRMGLDQIGRRNQGGDYRHPSLSREIGIVDRSGDYFLSRANARARNPVRYGFIDKYGIDMQDGMLEWREREKHHRLAEMYKERGRDYSFEE